MDLLGTNRIQIMSVIIHKLFEGYRYRQQEEINEIVEVNNKLLGNPFGAFYYKQNTYIAEGYPEWACSTPLDESLFDRAEEMFDTAKMIMKEQHKVKNWLSTLVLRANTTREVLALMPEHLHNYFAPFSPVAGDPELTDEFLENLKIVKQLKIYIECEELTRNRVMMNVLLGDKI